MITAAKKKIETPGGWLYIWGPPGNAKSEALIAIVNEANERGNGPAMYVKFSQIIQHMRDAFLERDRQVKQPGASMGYVDRFNELLAIPVLCIDEMDKARQTEFADEFRFDFLDERYRQGIHGKTTTVFASNTDPAELPMPIYDRIRDGRFLIVYNPAPSARPAMR